MAGLPTEIRNRPRAARTGDACARGCLCGITSFPGARHPVDRIKAVLAQVLNGVEPKLQEAQLKFTADDAKPDIAQRAKRIVIDPVTRIEGHAEINGIFLDDASATSRTPSFTCG